MYDPTDRMVYTTAFFIQWWGRGWNKKWLNGYKTDVLIIMVCLQNAIINSITNIEFTDITYFAKSY